MRPYYNSFSNYLKNRFGEPVWRLSLNAGFSCPNRDGAKSAEGCIFCNEEGFANYPKTDLSLDEQIRHSIDLLKRRNGTKKFIAYFQNASNTYGPIEELKKAYDTITAFPEIVGLSISTRPDCIDDAKLDLVASYADRYDLWIEYGLQSANEKTLRFINRHHDYAVFKDAVIKSAQRGIKAAAHIILGLPGESREDMLRTADLISDLPLSALKLHAFHILSGTKARKMYEAGEITLMDKDEYVTSLCDFLERIDPDLIMMRLVSNAKEDVLVAPKWVNEKDKVLSAIDREFEKRGTRQGSRYGARDIEKAGMA